MRNLFPRLLTVLLLLLPSMARAQRTPAAERFRMFEQHKAALAGSIFQAPRWQFLGPTNISGRMTDVAVVSPKGASYTIYVAGATGGVWRTTNEGTTWEPIFDREITASIGDVTLAPSNQDIVWVGTGEANIFRSSNAGAGVWKSTDAGRSWQHMGLHAVGTIPRIVVHPTDPQVVYVAAAGNEWTANPERGLYKTSDGGQNWEKVLQIDTLTGINDLVMDPANPNTLYATTWQRVRRKWNDPRLEPGFDKSSIYKSTDAGRTWNQINNGLPEARYRGRIGIDISRSNPRVLYAFVDNYEIARQAAQGELNAYGLQAAPVIRGATVFRSDDAGATWRRVSEYNRTMESLAGTYGWVFGQIRVDPNDVNRIYVMGVPLVVSDDAGKTFRTLRGMHSDHHGLWIDPANSNYLVNVNDGGIAVSYDRGANWRTFYDNLPLVQFFNVTVDNASPARAYGSIQDHGSRRGTIDLSRGRNSIPAQDWVNAPGGEGTIHGVDPRNPNIVYSTSFYGNLWRDDLSTNQRVNIVPRTAPGEPPLRMQWLTPFILSTHNPDVIYHGAQHLYRSPDRGQTWQKISPDLTYNNPAFYGDIPYQTIFSIAESPLRAGLLYAGTDDGRVHITRDDGRNWSEITSGLVPGKFIAEIVASQYDEGTVFLVQNGKRDDDFRPYIWKSTDYGRNWSSLVNGLASGPVNVIKEDPRNRNVLYVGTDQGAYASVDAGRSWQALPAELPTTYVHDLAIQPRDDILVAATHGRGMYALDVRPIQQTTPEVLAKPLHLYEPGEVALPRGGGGGFGGGAPAGTAIYYFAKSAGPVTLAIRDGSGASVRELSGTARTGVNLITWDLSRAAAGENQRPATVAAGVYNVELKQGANSAVGQITIVR